MTKTNPRWRSRVINLLLSWLPNHVKRMIFVTTISKLMRENEPITDDTIHYLNSIMDLSEREDAIRFSAYFTDTVWQGRSLQQICAETNLCQVSEMNESQIADVLASIRRNIPQHLVYGRVEDIEADIKTLLNKRDLIITQ